MKPYKSVYSVKQKVKEQSDYLFQGDNGYRFQNEDEMYQLELFLENDGDLYRQQIIPTIKNIQSKIKSGRYNHSMAPKAWMYLVDAGAKKFAPEYLEYEDMNPNISWNTLFPKKDRMVLAQKLADYYYDEIMSGNYD